MNTPGPHVIGGSNPVEHTRPLSGVHTGAFACLTSRFAQFQNPEAISAKTENPGCCREFPVRNAKIDAGQLR